MSLETLSNLATRAGLSALAIAAVIGATALPVGILVNGSPAFADQHSGPGEGPGEGAGGGSGGSGGGHDDGGHDDDGHDDDGHDDGGHEGGGHEGGQGGHNDGGHDSGDHGGEGQGQGGSAQGGGGEGGMDSRPTWAGEGIPEVELGRLNVARSPNHVLERAYNEALATMTPEMIAFYNLSMDDMLDQLVNNWDGVSFIDSPLQNLSILEALMTGEASPASLGISNDAMTLAAVALGAASDKSIPISEDTVVALSVIMEMDMSPQQVADLATAAEAVRQAIAEGHG